MHILYYVYSRTFIFRDFSFSAETYSQTNVQYNEIQNLWILINLVIKT